MLVSDIMTAPALTLADSDPLDHAVELLGRTGISALPVLDGDDRVVGIVSEADVLRQPLPRDPRVHLRSTTATSDQPRLVGDVMTRDPVCVASSTDGADLAVVFAEKGFKSVPVVDDGRLVGVVSRSDILRAMSTSSAELNEALERAFESAGLPGRGFTVRSGHVVLAPAQDGLDEAAVGIVATVPGVRSVRLA